MTYRGVNALADTANGYFKAELIYGPEQGLWKNVDEVKLATLACVHWHDTQRLHSVSPSSLGGAAPERSRCPPARAMVAR